MKPTPARLRHVAPLIAVAIAATLLIPGCNARKRGVEIEPGHHLRYTGVPVDHLIDAAAVVLRARGYTTVERQRQRGTTRLIATGPDGRHADARFGVEDGASRILVRVEPGHERGASLDLIAAILDQARHAGDR